jgi:hypothetical protein
LPEMIILRKVLKVRLIAVFVSVVATGILLVGFVFNALIDRLVKADARVVACIGLAQQAGAEAALRSRGIALESAAVAFPRYAAEGATVITF